MPSRNIDITHSNQNDPKYNWIVPDFLNEVFNKSFGVQNMLQPITDIVFLVYIFVSLNYCTGKTMLVFLLGEGCFFHWLNYLFNSSLVDFNAYIEKEMEKELLVASKDSSNIIVTNFVTEC